MTDTATVKRKALDAVDRRRDESVAFLQELVRIPSPEGEGERIIHHIASKLRQFDASAVDEFVPDVAALRAHPAFSPVHREHGSAPAGAAPVVVATFKGAGNGKSLMFYGHMESATPGWEPALVERMQYDPFEAKVVGDRLYGRAAYNMKSGNAAGVMALRAIQDAGLIVNGDVLFNFNSDEDVGSNGALASVLKGYRADAGINPEPSSLWICPATAGPMWFRIEVTGRSAFAGLGGGVSAIDKAIPIYLAIRDYAEKRKQNARHPLYTDVPNPVPLSVGFFRAGNWPSNLPQLAVMEGRIGCLPGEDLDAVKTEFESVVHEAAAADEWLKNFPPTIIWTARWDPVLTPLEHPFVQTTIRTYRELLGDEPIVRGKTAGMDMTKIANFGNVPSVNIGPKGGPFGGQISSPEALRTEPFDEFVSLDSYHTLTRLFALTILEWCGVAAT